MKLVFLGTGGFHPNERRHTAGILIPELGVMFDAGSSTFRAPSRLQSPELQLFLTHAHLDHIQGLTYLLVPMLDGRLQRCRVYGLPATLNAVQKHLFAESIFPVMPAFDFIPLESAVEVPQAGSVSFTPLNHPGGSLGFRLKVGSSTVAYITDTMVDGTYTDFIRGCDVLIHECYFPDELAGWCEPTGHSHTSQVAQQAKEAGVKRLYLTHIDPNRPSDDPLGIDKARVLFPATELAEDLLEIDF